MTGPILRPGPSPGVALSANGGSLALSAQQPSVSLGVSAGPSSLAHILFGANQVRTTTTTRYLFPGYNDSAAPTSPICIPAMRAVRLCRMFILHNTPNGNGEDVIYTLRKNGAPTALSVTMASTDAIGFNLTDTVEVIATDLLDIEVTKPLSLGPGLGPADVIAILGVK